MKLNQHDASSMRLLVLLLSMAGTHAYVGLFVFDSLTFDETVSMDTKTEADAADSGSTEFVQSYIHIVDSTLITVIAWVVVVITLEVNDFRHHLMAKYDGESSSFETSQRYIASLMAIQYGMYDAVMDWSIIYTIAYAIIGGLTWHNADINFLTVIWGISLMATALILAVAGVKMPEWLGFYRMSQFKTIQDTSGFAAKAVQDLTAKGSTIAAFRYQARLGVGKHFTQFFWLLLPFYTNLHFWWYLLSIFIGFVLGQLFILIVFMCREKFPERRGYVAMGASAFIAIGSAIAFMRAVEIVNIGWNRGIGKLHVILPISFFVWLAAIALFHGWKYVEHRNFETDQVEPQLFASTVHDDGNAGRSTLETLAEGDGSDDEKNDKVTPHQVYKTVAGLEKSEADVSWYHRVWHLLPLKAIWDLFLIGTLDICRCCARKGTELKTEFQEMSCGKKTWFVFRKIFKLLINLICIILAIVACGDAHQTGVTRAKLPYVQGIYKKLNEGPVCAYDEKCGDIKSFDSREAAHAANYSVAHCGVCSGCSTWQDMSVQWSTRKQAAAMAQSCGARNLFDEASMAKCFEREFGWTSLCSEAWVHSVVCAREQCAFIALRTLITNQMGNFQMQKTSVTPATCNEAQCEQGTPGEFAKLSGASRRKMNIRSSIDRAPDQQCQIVDNIPRDAEGRYNDWGPFFKELCPRSDSLP